MTTMLQYSLDVFEDVKKEGFDFQFDPSVINMIQDIAEKVGAPGYIKTPIFAKKKKPTIKATVFKQEIACLFDEIKVDIRKMMNKISNDSYDTIVLPRQFWGNAMIDQKPPLVPDTLS